MTKSLAKMLLVFASLVLVALFVVGIGQTIKLNSLQNEFASVSQKDEDIKKELETVDDKLEYVNGKDYQDDYLKQEEDYGEDGDKIYRESNLASSSLSTK